jgi:hypothetical protein
LQAAAPGVQSRVLQELVVESQYWVERQVEYSVEVIPSVLQRCTVVPWQNRELGVQSWVLQVPCEQTKPESMQSSPPSRYPEPSALQVVASVPLQAAVSGVQSRVRQVAVPVDVSQNWVERQVE